MPFEPDQPSPGGSFVPDEDIAPPPGYTLDETPSIGGFAKNLGQDVIGNVKGVANLAKGLVTHPIDTAEAIPGALMNEAKRVGVPEMATGIYKGMIDPLNMTGNGDVGQPQMDALKKVGGAFYDKPLTTGLDFSTLLGGGEGTAAEAGKTAEMAEKAVPISEEITKAAPAAEAGKTALSGLVDKIKGQIPTSLSDPADEVKQYLMRQYGKTSEKPGFAQTAADYLDRYAQNMSVKNMGASPMQIKQIGPEAGRALGKYAMDKGVTDPLVGDIGMEQKVSQINKQAGDQIGALRKLADTKGKPPAIDDIMNAVKTKFDPIYTQGIKSGEKGSYMKALSELKRAEPTHEGLADTVTTLNHSATAANRLNQASGSISDVANEISRLNHASIANKLSPQELQSYEAALKDYGATKKIQQFMIRKGSREAAGRLGPGGGVRQIVQNFLDGYGYKAQAKIASKMADFIRSNPDKVSSPPALFKEFINQIEDLGSDMTDATH